MGVPFVWFSPLEGAFLYTSLKRPLLAAVVSGALVAGGVVLTAPAFAAPAPGVPGSAVAADEPAADPSTDPSTDPSAEPPSAEPSAPESPSAEPSSSVPSSLPSSDAPAPEPSGSAPGSEPASVPPSSEPPAPDTEAPKGSFKLSLSSFWVGQRTTLTLQGVSDDVSTPDQITRVITWGDGTTSRLAATQATVTKQFVKSGKFPVTMTLTDAAGNKKTQTSTITVTKPGTFKLNKSAVWHHEIFKVTIGSVPAGTTKIALHWGDGWATALQGRNQTVSGMYYHRYKGPLVPAGPVALTAVFTNKNGSTTPITVGRITIKKDSSKPVLKITTPKNPNRVSSWKTLRGAVTDKGSGGAYVAVIPMKASGGKVYCYTSKKTWIRVYDDTDLSVCITTVKVTKGKWSLALKGLTKGELFVSAAAQDWSDNVSNGVQVDKKLTRS